MNAIANRAIGGTINQNAVQNGMVPPEVKRVSSAAPVPNGPALINPFQQYYTTLTGGTTSTTAADMISSKIQPRKRKVIFRTKEPNDFPLTGVFPVEKAATGQPLLGYSTARLST
ncbi:MAG: hypothetical protein GF341_02080 [candidate division Zixibacteria bacterium]|nr:hypothetical protein [candidate division Zixibacteria bacterium]